MLTGKINYGAPNPDFRRFAGFFKLKKDPKNEPIKVQNVIYRGTVY